MPVRVLRLVLPLLVGLALTAIAPKAIAQTPGNLTITDVSMAEGDSGNANMTFTVNFQRISCSTTCNVNWTTQAISGGATAGTDYTTSSGSLSFPSSPFTCASQALPVTVAIFGDTTSEPHETFNVVLSGQTGCSIADSTGVGTISNDDAVLSINDVSNTEGNPAQPAPNMLTFRISLQDPSVNSVAVNWATADGTAISGAAAIDFTSNSGTATLRPSSTGVNISIPITGDVLDEADETMFINLSGAVAATIGDAQGLGTILDDDASPNLSVSTPRAVTEGNTGTVPYNFTLTLDAVSGRTVTVGYNTSNNTMTAPADYVALSGTATFPAGTTQVTVPVTINGDLLDEASPDTFNFNLTNPVNVTLTVTQIQGRVTDDDAPPNMNIADVTVTEGNSGTSNAAVTVTLDAPSGLQVDANWVANDGTAFAGADYNGAQGVVTFAPGVTSQQVVVQVIGETLFEGDEFFTVDLASPTNATLVDGSAEVTIADNDPVPSATINDVSVTEGAAPNTTLATFTVTLSNPSASIVSVDAATANVTAVSPSDYVAVGATTLQFGGNFSTTQRTFSVTVNGDGLDEANETFNVVLSNPIGVTIGDGTGVGTITDDDAAPSISIDDVTVTETDSGTTNAVFTVTLSAVSGQTITVAYATANSTAVAPGDYANSSGTLTFAAGVRTQQITVPVAGDVLDEANETFNVNLSNPTGGATLADGVGLGTITDNDAAPTLSIADAVISEGNSGSTTLNLAVTLSAASGQTVTVQYASGSGTATPGTDYTAANGTLTFAPGTVSQNAAITVLGDATDEPNETFPVTLSLPVNATLVRATGTGTINDDDAPPSVSINDVSVSEGNAGTVTAAFTLSLSAASGLVVTVNYATANGTAVAPGDYTAASGVATFPAGTTSQTVNVTVNGDTLDEANETFTVALSAPSNATIGTAGTGTGTINDDDASPSLSIADATINEGNSGSANVTFTVTLSAASGRTVTVAYATADGTAASPADYTARNGTLTFGPGVLTQTFTVSVLGDVLDEGASESFTVTLSAPTNATIADTQALATITDDDNAPTVSIADASATEANAGPVDMTFNVTLSAASALSISVDFATSNGTALSGSDYTARTGTVVFPAGTTMQTITVSILGDVIDEVNETLTVTLSNASNVSIADATATGTINDNDAPPAISIANVSIAEGNSGSSNVTFTVSLSNASGQTVSASWATADGTAVAGADYVAANGTVSFAAGTTTQNITVAIDGDTLDEIDETFTVTLTSPSNATIGSGVGTATILDNDLQPSISIGDINAGEPTGAPVDAVFTVSLSAPSGRPVSVDYATSDGTALAGSDYQLTTGNLIFMPGETSHAIQVPVEGDAIDENDETFVLSLVNAVNAAIAVDHATATIADDDAPSVVSIGDVAVVESDGTAVLDVVLSAPSGFDVSVEYATADGTARSGSDYDPASGRVVIPAGALSAPVAIVLLGDVAPEAIETFDVALANAVNASIGAGVASVRIVDDDVPPDLSVDVVGAGDFVVGSVGTFTVSIANAGPGATIGPIVVRDQLPDGLGFASANAGWSCEDTAGLVTCTSTAVLLPNDPALSLALNVNIGAEAYPSVTTTATVTTASDANFANDTKSVLVDVTGLADLAIEKTRSSSDPVLPGQPISWTLTVTNLGPNAVRELFVIDEMPLAVSDAQFVLNGPGAYDAASGLISGVSIDPDQTVVLVVNGMLSQTATGALANRALVSVANGFVDPSVDNNSSTHVAMISGDVDCDHDGLTDEEERMLGTEPCIADTDGDGLVDGIEVHGLNPTNPLDPDTDGDVLCDGPSTKDPICVAGEDKNANGMIDPGETDPNNPDSDGGGISDGEEAQRGTDPTITADDQDRGCTCDAAGDATGDAPRGERSALAWLILLITLPLLRRTRMR